MQNRDEEKEERSLLILASHPLIPREINNFKYLKLQMVFSNGVSLHNDQQCRYTYIEVKTRNLTTSPNKLYQDR